MSRTQYRGVVVTVPVEEQDEGFTLSPELEEELLEAMAEADHGETVDGWELLRDLKS